MFATHVRRGWALRRNRASGSAIVIALLALTGSGYALYYLVDDGTRPLVSVLHWGLGIAFVPALVVHVALGRRYRRAALGADAKHLPRHARARLED
jgi:hypothetical protein